MDEVEPRADDSQLCVRDAKANERKPAIDAIFGDDWDSSESLLRAVDSHFGIGEPQKEPLASQGKLLVAVRGERVVAATWLHPLSPAMATIYPPSDAADESARQLLANTLRQHCESGSYQVIRTLITPSESTAQKEWVEWIGLRYATRIESMFCPVNAPFLTRSPGTNAEIAYEQVDALPGDASFARLTELAQATFQDSQDCPQLTNLVPAAAIFGSYQYFSTSQRRFWYRVSLDSDQSVDVGLLLLSEVSEDEQLDLVYLGIKPAFRGRGYGGRLLEFARNLASQRQLRRISLAVDAQNQPAKAIYESADFVKYAEHDMYLRGRKKGNQ